MHRILRDLSFLGVEITAMTAGTIVGLLVVSQLLHSATLERVATIPIVGPFLAGLRAASDRIVTPS